MLQNDNMDDIIDGKIGGWTCIKCTLENASTSQFCEACGNRPQPVRNKSPTKDDGRDVAISSNNTCVVMNSKKSNGLLSMLSDVRSIASKFVYDKPKNNINNVNENISLKLKQEEKLVTNISAMAIDTGTVGVVTETGAIDNQFESDVKERKNEESDKNHMNLYKCQTSVNSVDIRKVQEHEALEKSHEIVKFCKEMKMPFVDDSFPPNGKSLTFSGRPITNVHVWLRPIEISILTRSKVRWEVFRNPRPSDIVQGIIGNCWFLSALAVVCEKPELLEQILITKEVCKEGVYQVRICKNGEWVIVLVDDLIPCDARGIPVYSQAARNQLWVPLIEKAVAKSVGCYEALVAGRCIEALQLLTGMPCESIVLQNKSGDVPEDAVDIDMVWAKILTCRDAGYLMGASCGGDVVDEDLIQHFHNVGLEAQHAYSVLDIQQVNEHRLIRLRNPWGRYSWTGAWSDESPSWTDALRQRLDPHGSVEGVFWISLEDMMNYFDCIDICKYQPQWTEVALTGNFASPLTNTGQVCHLTVFAPTELDITLFQESNRGSQTESLATLDLMIGVYRATSGTSEPKPLSYVSHSNRKIKPSVLCNLFLDAGVYIIIPFAFNHWNSGILYTSPPKYMLSIHSSKPVLTDHILMPRYSYSDALFLMVERLGKRHEGISGVTCYYMSYHLAGLIVAAENRRTDVHLHVDCNCSNSFNVVATRGSMMTSDCMPPLHRQILTVLTQLEGTDGYAVTHKLKFRISPLNAFNSHGSHQQPLLVNGLGEVHNPRPL